MTPIKTLLSACVLLAAYASAGTNHYITIGDPAPAFKPAKWLKGHPVSQFEKGKFYVVEFWATWCGPCKENIPHLTELAKKYKGQVSIIGCDVWETREGVDEAHYMKKVTQFVKGQGSKMDYNVAVDGPKSDIATGWMTAASEGGIPCSFIIDGTGKIAWIGHPANMEDTLKQVLAGKFDVASARNKREIELVVKRPVDEAMASQDYPAAIKAIDYAVEKFPQFKYNLTYPLLVALYHADLDRGIARSQEILKESDHAIGAYQMMSSIFATFPDLSPAAYKFGLTILDEGAKLGQGTFLFKAMLANTYFNMGDVPQAIKVAEESVALADNDPHASPEMKALVKKNLSKYKAGKG